MDKTERQRLLNAMEYLGAAAIELRLVLGTENALLADFVLSLLEQVNPIEARIKRLLPEG